VSCTSTVLRKVTRRTFGAAALAAFAIHSRGAGAQAEKWVVYYSDQAPAAAFEPYSTVVLDSRYHPPLAPLAAMGKKLIGYVSIGEASQDYTYFEALRTEGLLLRPNPVWQGNWSIDIRDRRWWTRLADEIIPRILERGFHGLFLDTIDTVLYLEEQNPREFGGMAAAAEELIATLHSRYRQCPLILNRSYAILGDVAEHLYAAVGEPVYATYDFSTKQYKLVSNEWYEKQVGWLSDALRRNPQMRIFTLDYWNPDDKNGIRRIYARERKNGFVPYVSTIDLTKLIPEP
jgi:polysaccharide biosynthesis protein PelA